MQSGLYRVTYTGDEDTSPVDMTPTLNPLQQLRRELEAYHGKQTDAGLKKAWGYLDHSDRFISGAARVMRKRSPPMVEVVEVGPV